MGFCFFNSVAVAARHAVAALGLERVAIVDIDIHHGNGTQDTFYDDPSVLYVSTHQYPYYPGTGHWREIGEGPGIGTTLDLSLPGGWALIGRLDALAGELCDGRIVVALEGGYDGTALPWSVRNSIETLMGEPPTSDPLGPAPPAEAPDLEELITAVRELHGIDAA
jgi:acetoin utilization deacetylase AcuC-like enzyme